MEIRRSYDRLISTIGFPILARWHLYIASGPCLLQKQLTIQWQTQWYFCVSLSQNLGSINIFVSLMWRKICPSFSGNPWKRCFCSHDKNGADKKLLWGADDVLNITGIYFAHIMGAGYSRCRLEHTCICIRLMHAHPPFTECQFLCTCT